MQNSRSKKKVVRIDDSARAQLKKRVNHVLYDTTPPMTDYINSLAKSKAKSPTFVDTYKPTVKEKTELPPIQYSGVEPINSSYDSGFTSYDSGSASYDSGSTSYDSGSTSYDSGSTSYDSGSNSFDSGSNSFDSGSNAFASGSNAYDSGSNSYESGSNVYDSGSNVYDSGSNSYNYNMYIQPTEPISTYTEPISTYTEPMSTYTEPISTYIEPMSTYTEPVSTYTEPVSTYTEPVSTYTKPVSTYTEPVSTYTKPVSTYTEPVSTYTEPVSTYKKPEPTNTEPVSTNTEPISTNTEPISTNTETAYVDPTPIPEYKAEQGRDFDASLLTTSSKYTYDEEGPPSTEYYNSRRFEEFILNKGFLILEYFVQNKLCSFILLQLPYISESMMVYVNRKKYPIDVSNSSYPKTQIEKLKVDKLHEDRLDYENITLDGFDIQHSLDVMDDTNVQQKSLAYYLRRQLSRLMYITKNIEIKPCLIMSHLLGFHDIYHINDRPLSKEFFPVISLEILFSKTFVLEQNLPVFYKKFYSIVNQSNINKMNSLEDSLVKLVLKIKDVKSKLIQQMTLESDQTRVKNILFRLQVDEQNIMKEKEKPPSTYDPVGQSYNTKRLDQEKQNIDIRRHECNQIYMEIKRAYDHFVFENEISFYELYNKIQDMEELIKYLE